jgi:hypothetical protein
MIVLTTRHVVALSMADLLERICGTQLDDPEGTDTVQMSVTLVREIVRCLRLDA